MKRKGFFTLVLALMMLLFATLAAVFINEMSQELLVTISKLDEGKEERYNKIVMKSIENSINSVKTEITDRTIRIDDISNSTYTLVLPKYYTSTNYSSMVIDFKTVSTFLATENSTITDVTPKMITGYFFQVEIEPSTSTRSSTEALGAIIKYSE